MSLKSFVKKGFQFIDASKHFYKYGGYTQVSISQINYGELFSPDSTVLITGGSRGIGLAMCKRFLANGARVIITGRNPKTLSQVENDLSNSLLTTLKWDVSDLDSFSQYTDLFKEVDILINNAGIYAKTSFPDCTSEDWDNVYKVNAKGVFFMCQEACKAWINYKNDKIKKIINITSQGGFSSANNPYRMTKWDIRGFTNYLGQAMSQHGIIVNSIAPGIIVTDMQPSFQKQLSEGGKNYYTNNNPIKRLGLPEEIAELAVFLASDAANFIVGQTICCDGGYTIR